MGGCALLLIMYINKRIVQREIESIPLLLSNLLPFTPTLEYNIERPIKERCQNEKILFLPSNVYFKLNFDIL